MNKDRGAIFMKQHWTEFLNPFKTLRASGKSYSPASMIQSILLKSLLISFSLSFFINSTYADEHKRLEENIVSLKEKIRNSNTKDPKDIQRLYRLENELEKKLYLKKNNKVQ